MGANLSTKDIYALELFASTEYFQELRDAFSLCLKAAEDALEIFMRHLPPDYRSRHVSLQPDAVWGELVLPNMRWTLQELNQGYIQVSHGNLDGLQTSGNVRTTFASISREFVWDWMNSKNQLEFEEQWTIASRAAANISRTTLGNWLNGAHSGLVPKDEQDNWPIYRLNDSVQVRTNDEVTVSGVYVSDSVGSCAQFLIAATRLGKLQFQTRRSIQTLPVQLESCLMRLGRLLNACLILAAIRAASNQLLAACAAKPASLVPRQDTGSPPL